MRRHALLIAIVIGSVVGVAGVGRSWADVVLDLPAPPRSTRVVAADTATRVPSATDTTGAPDVSATKAPETTKLTDAGDASGSRHGAAAPARTIDVGTVAMVRYGGARRAPRNTGGPYPRLGYGGYGYGGYGYGGCYGYAYPIITRYHFGLGVHVNHGRVRVIGYPYYW